MNNYPYLNDSAFLFELFKSRNLEQLVQITVLNFNEKPLKEIQGRVLSGSLNLDGNSSVRRTGNLSVYIDENDASYMEVGGCFSMNKKVKIEIGIINNTSDYTDYPIIWFPQGIFVIMSISISRSEGGTTASLQLKDKMVFLNGECGGVIPAAITFSEYEELDPETGDYILKQPTLVQIIKEVVTQFGGEQLGKIIVSDIDTRIKKVMKWTKNVPLYSYESRLDGLKTYLYTLTEPTENNPASKTFTYGRDVGYINVDFYYPGELVGSAGETVCSVLDKIKNLLGNFEYYYDINGNFIFQEIKNYLNNTPKIQDISQADDAIRDGYIIQPRRGKALYDFSGCQELITSYSNSPQYAQVKNDFVVWGEREGITGNKLPIRYHLAIDKKPTPGEHLYNFFLIKDEKVTSDDIYHARLPISFSTGANFPTIGEIERIYLDESTGKVYRWNPESKTKYQPPCPVPCFTETVTSTSTSKNENGEDVITATTTTYTYSYYYELNPITDYARGIDFPAEGEALKIYHALDSGKYYTYAHDADVSSYSQDLPSFKTSLDPDGKTLFHTRYTQTTKTTGIKTRLIRTTDWRSELYFSGAMTSRFGNDANYYYTELVNEWPKLYEIVATEERIDGEIVYTDKLKDSVAQDPTAIDYYLDFIDSTAAISEFSIENIGRRSKVETDDSLNCIFEFPIEDVILIPAGRDSTDGLRTEAQSKNQSYTQVDENIYNGLSGGGSQNSVYNKIRDLLYQHTNYNESVSIQMLPLYFLEPNIRIYLHDSESGIHGDYMINSISMPMDIGGQMSLSCSKALERI